MNTTRKLKFGDIGFWPKWFGKLLFTLISVKVWGLVAGTVVSTWLLMVNMHHKPIMVGDSIIEYGINGTQWVTFNTTIWALIFGMKEIFRISEQHDNAEQEILRENLDGKVRMAEMMANDCLDPEMYEIPVKPEHEVVGNDPEETLKP